MPLGAAPAEAGCTRGLLQSRAEVITYPQKPRPPVTASDCVDLLHHGLLRFSSEVVHAQEWAEARWPPRQPSTAPITSIALSARRPLNTQLVDPSEANIHTSHWPPLSGSISKAIDSCRREP